MLPEKELIHTYVNPCTDLLIGADWERRDIIKAINKYHVELTGEYAKNSGHGIAFNGEHGWVFVETKESIAHPNPLKQS